MATKKGGLGKGLEALFNDVEIDLTEEGILEKSTDTAKKTQTKINKNPAKKTTKVSAKDKDIDENSIVFLDINDIRPNESQPRKKFDEAKIAELSASILEHGVIQPLIVRKTKDAFELVAGERRWRAARMAQLKKVPCIVRELSDEQNSLLAIIENMQREDLNPMEEADAISKMIDKYKLTQEQVAKSLSKSRPYITNALRLKKLPEKVQAMVSEGLLSAGHARALVAIEHEEKVVKLAEKASKEGLSVREMEKLAAESSDKKKKKASKKKDPEMASVEAELKEILGTRVKIKSQGRKGKIEIEYYSQEELNRIIDYLRDK